MNSLDPLTEKLVQAGKRLTPQRAAICRLLCRPNFHPSAAGIFEELRPQYPTLSLMTVYNTLNSLVELGVLLEMRRPGQDTVFFDVLLKPHVNLECVTCHKIVDIPGDELGQIWEEVRTMSGFRLINGSVLYVGVCPSCQAEEGVKLS